MSCLLVGSTALKILRFVKDAKNQEQPQRTNAAGGVQMVANPACAQMPAQQPATSGAGMV